MKMILAIVRTTALERVVKSLEEIDVRGMTIHDIKGIGQQVTLNTPYSIHSRVEVIVPDDKADAVAGVILKYAHTGLPGDGLIAVFPVDYLIKVRTKERFSK